MAQPLGRDPSRPFAALAAAQGLGVSDPGRRTRRSRQSDAGARRIDVIVVYSANSGRRRGMDIRAELELEGRGALLPERYCSAPQNGRGRVHFSNPGTRARCASAIWPCRRERRWSCLRARSKASIWSALFSPSGHSMRKPFEQMRRRPFPVSRSWSYPHPGKARGQGFVSPPCSRRSGPARLTAMVSRFRL